MTDLAEFLLARLEAEQLRACSIRRMIPNPGYPTIEHVGGMTGVETYVVHGGMRRRISQDEYRALVEANSEPAPDEHAAATASALMQLVALHADDGFRCTTCAGEDSMDEDVDGNVSWSRSGIRWPCPTLRLLAVRWDDHPDYREEWAVT